MADGRAVCRGTRAWHNVSGILRPVGNDLQTPHEQDEVYFIHKGTGALVIAEERYSFEAGDCLFVAANVEHRFENFSEDFGTWVVFWGPKGGEGGGESK